MIMRRLMIILTVILICITSQSIWSHNRTSRVNETVKVSKPAKPYLGAGIDSVVITLYVPHQWNIALVYFHLHKNGEIVVDFDDKNDRTFTLDTVMPKDTIFKYVNRLFIERPKRVYSSIEPSSICKSTESPVLEVRLYRRKNVTKLNYIIKKIECRRILHYSDEFKHLFRLLFDIGLECNRKYGDDDDELFRTDYNYYPSAVDFESPNDQQKTK